MARKAQPGDKRLGNHYWRSRSSHGRKPVFKTPSKLERACEEYFDLVEENPLLTSKPHMFEGEIIYSKTPIMRAMTVKDLCRFLDISHQTWLNYKDHKNKGFLEVITRVENIIYGQKFAGAAGGLLNANIIARDLGLKDQSSVDVNAVNYELPKDITPEQAAEIYQDVLNGGKNGG